MNKEVKVKRLKSLVGISKALKWTESYTHQHNFITCVPVNITLTMIPYCFYNSFVTHVFLAAFHSLRKYTIVCVRV